MATGVASASPWRAKRRRIFHSVFQRDISQSTPHSTPHQVFPEQGQSSSATATEQYDLVLPDAGAGNGFLAPPASSLQPHRSSRKPSVDQIRYNRAWHIVTSRIALPSPVAAEGSLGSLETESQLKPLSASADAEFQSALRLILYARRELPRAAHREDILAWHTEQVRQHFVKRVLPLLAACAYGPATPQAEKGARRAASRTAEPPLTYDQPIPIVVSTVQTLEAAFRLYFYGATLISRGLPQAKDAAAAQEGDTGPLLPTAEAALTRFRRDVQALVGNSTRGRLLLSIYTVLLYLCGVLLGLRVPGDLAGLKLASGTPPAEDAPDTISTRHQLHEMIEAFAKLGLAGEQFQVLFGRVMNQLMSDYVSKTFARRWSSAETRDPHAWGSVGPSDRIASLYDWVENHFARVTLGVLSRISPGRHGQVSLSDVKKWKELALGRLAMLRISELFDMVFSWPLTRGGLSDLRSSLTTPQRRAQLVSIFTAKLKKILLGPARTTFDILRIYIAMIRTFHFLDPSNVLLSHAAAPLQLYLCQRDDAVRIVVTGLLANPEEAAEDDANRAAINRGARQGKITELASALDDPRQQRRQYLDDEDLDWDDLEWVPDPIDAGVNYKRPKSEDIIGTIIDALGSQDVFIKEFQNIMAERLLSDQPDFSREVKVLDLLKKRFGEGALHNCDVMLRDIQDSRRLDAAIHRAQQNQQRGLTTPAAPATPAGPGAQGRPVDENTRPGGGGVREGDANYHARILSRLYWPNLDNDPFLLPTPVADAQKRYEAEYGELKANRKLAWLDHLGQATVELELADRTLLVECKTYEAAVVYAFQPDPGADEGASGGRVRRSVEELVNMLRIDEDLARLALAFWQGRGVLRHLGADRYAVVETEGEAEEGAREGEGEGEGEGKGAALATPVKGPAAKQQDRGSAGAGDAQRAVYWQFIVGMLTNSASSMPVAQIGMMMKMLIADGFPWSNEELQEFLAEKVAGGELEVVGGKYRLVKK